MISAIDKMIGLYQMQANAMRILVTNTQKAFDESCSFEQVIASQQEQRLNRFVRDLSPAVCDMLTRFWFQKEHKARKHELLTKDRIKNLEDFTNFVKVLTESVRSLLARCRATSNQSFEQEFEKDLKQMEAQVRKKLREFDKALDRTNGRLRSPISKPLQRVSLR